MSSPRDPPDTSPSRTPSDSISPLPVEEENTPNLTQRPNKISRKGVHADEKAPEISRPATLDTRASIQDSPDSDDLGEVITTRSRASTTRSRPPATVIPRAKRRGLLGRFTIIPEVEKPYDYTNKTKWILTLVVALAGSGAPLGSSIIWPALHNIAVEYNTTDTIANFSVAFYMLAMSIFPLWWSAFSETLGRRTVFISSFTLFIVFSVGSAVSNSILMFIVMRVLGGGASASVQAVGAGAVADIWEVHERGRAMGFFYLGPLLGPLIAPIVGGAMTEAFGWRSTMWFLAIYGAVIWILIVLCLPETLTRSQTHPPPETLPPPTLTQTPSHASTALTIGTKKTAKVVKKYLLEPLCILSYLRYPPILLTVSYASLTFGALFLLNVSIQLAFSSSPYNYTPLTVGLLYLPPSVGYASASILGGPWIDLIMRRAAQRANRIDPSTGKLIYLPEDRMRENAWLSATLFPAGLVVYGWTIQHGLHWAIPSAATLAFGVGAMLVFSATTTMLTEFMPRRSSSGVALNNFVRNIFSCLGTVVAEPLIGRLGHGWSLSVFAAVAWVGGNGCIWALRRFGEKWRRGLGGSMG